MNREEIKELEIEYCFNLIDTSNTNNISLQEAKKAAKLLRNRFGITEDVRNILNIRYIFLLFQITEWLKDADLNNDGKLSYDEFRHNIQMRQLEQVVVEG